MLGHFHLSLRGNCTALTGPNQESTDALRDFAKNATIVLVEDLSVLTQCTSAPTHACLTANVVPRGDRILIFAVTSEQAPLAYKPVPTGAHGTIDLTSNVSPAKMMGMLRAMVLGLEAAGLWFFNDTDFMYRPRRPFAFTRYGADDFAGIPVSLHDAMAHYQTCAIRYACLVQHSTLQRGISRETVVADVNIHPVNLFSERFFFVPREALASEVWPTRILRSDSINPIM